MLTTTPGGSGVTAIVRLPKAILEVVGAPGTSAPVVDVPAMAQVLSEPLPLTVSVAAAPMMMEQAPSDMSDEALWEAMKAPAAAVAPVALAPDGVTTGVVPAIEPLGTPSLTTQSLTTQSGLTKRVRGCPNWVPPRQRTRRRGRLKRCATPSPACSAVWNWAASSAATADRDDGNTRNSHGTL